MGADGLHRDVVTRFKGPIEWRLGEDFGDAVIDLHEPERALSRQERRVVPSQALHANGDAKVFGKMSNEFRGEPIVGPFARSVDDHAFAPVLRNSERLREVSGKKADVVHPSAPPEVAGLRRSPKMQVRRAIPAKVVEGGRPRSFAAGRSERDADLVYGLPAEIGNAPPKNGGFPWRKRGRLAVQRAERVIRAIDFDPQHRLDG